jgi:hypothetical protein
LTFGRAFFLSELFIGSPIDFYIIAANVSSAVHDALDTECLPFLSMEDKVPTMRQHSDTVPQFGAQCSDAWRLSKRYACGSQFPNKANSAAGVVTSDEVANFFEVTFSVW